MSQHRAVLNVLFPAVRAEILRALFVPSRRQLHGRELARTCGFALCTVQDELRKLSALRLILNSRSGKYKLHSANRSHPLFQSLVRFIQLSERLPPAYSSALKRPPKASRPVKRRKRRVAVPSMRPDRQPNWNLFKHS